MPNQHTITVPVSAATERQILVTILNRISEPTPAPDLGPVLERLTVMAEQIDRLNTAVEQELADDAAQNELIAELRSQLEQARAAADAAIAGEDAAKANLTAALDAADAAAARLESNDPQPEPSPEPEQPVEPEPQF